MSSHWKQGIITASLVAALVLLLAPPTSAQGCPAGAETWRGLQVCEEQPWDGYDRAAFGSAYSSLEDEIIAALPTTMKADGQVYTPYSCLPFDITDQGTAATDIEHIVALAEAHDSRLADDRRRDIAADIDNLTIADPTVNRSQKSDRDAAEWMPARHGAWFATRVIQVKLEYGLSVDPAERDALEALLAGGGAELNCVAADTTVPTVTITSTASEPVSGPFSITVTFSEPVTGFELADLVVGNGSASELQGNEASYTATVTPAASGAVTVDIASGAAQDRAGTPSAAADQFSITANLTQSRDEFSYWDVDDDGDLTCAEAEGRDEGLRLPAYQDNRNGTGIIYQWLERNQSSDTDNDGIACESSSNPNGYIPKAADTTAPTVTISSTASAPVNGPFPIMVTFSESVIGFELADLVVGNGTASELQRDNASYTATVTPAASGAVTVDIAAGAAQDSAGNPSAAADQFSITADTAAPTVTITSTASEPVSGPFSVTVSFSEPVTGFELSDLVVGNGTASELQGDDASYTATVTPAASGAVTVDIAAGAAQDSAGNPSAAADQFSIIADLTPVPALPVVGAIALAMLLLVGGVRRRGGALTTT